MGPVFNSTCHPSKPISLGALKCFVGFKKVIFEPIEHCDIFYPQGRS